MEAGRAVPFMPIRPMEAGRGQNEKICGFGVCLRCSSRSHPADRGIRKKPGSSHCQGSHREGLGTEANANRV